jgi:hypothetical protein
VWQGDREHHVIALRFPAEIAVGEVWWEDAREPGGSSHLLAIGVVEVPDGTPIRLTVGTVAEVGTYGRDQMFGIFGAESQPTWTVGGSLPMIPRRRRRVRLGLTGRYRRRERVTWHQGMPDRALRNTRSIWGEPGEPSCYVGSGEEAVDLEFIRGLPADSVFDLSVTGDVVPASFAAVVHLAPGLRDLSVYLDNLGADASSVIADLSALESLSLSGGSATEDGPGRLDDYALSVIADLSDLEYLSLLDGSYSEHGLRQLGRLPKLQHLQIEREGLTPSMFRFAATMPALTRLSGLDEFLHDGPMPPAEVDQVRAMLPHITVGLPARQHWHPVNNAAPSRVSGHSGARQVGQLASRWT